MQEDNLVFYGDGVKAFGEGKVAGYLVRYGTPADVDLEGDYFDPETDYGVEDGARLPVYYQHGLDATLKSRKIGKGSIKVDDVGLWLEAQLEMRDDYERAIYGLAEAGKLGLVIRCSWASGRACKPGKIIHDKIWPIAEASLTPTPAEPRNTAVTVKSLIEPETVVTEQIEDEHIESTIITEEVHTMDEIDYKELLKQAVTDAADEAVKKYREAEPKVQRRLQSQRTKQTGRLREIRLSLASSSRR